MLPADNAAAQWFEEWAERCERDATRPSSWSCATRTTTRGYTFRELHVEGLGTITPPSWPSPVTLGSARWRRFASDAAGVAWMGSLIPGLPASWARLGASTIGSTNGFRDVAHGDPAFLERLFDQDVRLGDDANLLLAARAERPTLAVRTVAVDVTISAHDDGRLDPRGVGEQVGRLASSGLVTPACWLVPSATWPARPVTIEPQCCRRWSRPSRSPSLPSRRTCSACSSCSRRWHSTAARHSPTTPPAPPCPASLARARPRRPQRGSSRWTPMTTTADDLVYRYVAASALRDDGGRLELDLATSGGCGPNPWLAEGFLRAPETAARALLLVANVAGARLLDPAQHGRRRHRGRRPRRHDVERGTQVRVVLAVLRCLRTVRLGRRRARRHRPLARDHERRRQPAPPRLARTNRPSRSLAPARWSRRARREHARRTGRREARAAPRALGARLCRGRGRHLHPRARARALERGPRQFLQQLPRGGSRGVGWVVPSGTGARLSTRHAPGALAVGGIERLRVLREMAPFIRVVTAFGRQGGSASQGSSCSVWSVDVEGGHLALALSPEPSRGFSGEGGLLYASSTAVDAKVEGAAAGRLGYDVRRADWFPRELPFSRRTLDRPDGRLAKAVSSSPPRQSC